ncbi:hypothetical protein ACPCYX_16715 [Pseudomonas fluorescens]|uniref:hypothetical protein n=1 Tax=Pseudomonas fluorescens TaxID=294 RepID=UPI003C1825CC
MNYKADALTRAIYAFCARSGGPVDQPCQYLSDVEEHDGLRYVVLRNVNGLLAVYRITAAGMLRRMKRWPKVISAIAQGGQMAKPRTVGPTAKPSHSASQPA